MGSNKEVIQGGVAVASILSLFEATIVFLKAIGVLHTDEATTNAILTYGRIVLPIVITFFVTLWVARRTTSLATPEDETGTPLVRKDTHGPTIAQARKEQKSIERSIKR